MCLGYQYKILTLFELNFTLNSYCSLILHIVNTGLEKVTVCVMKHVYKNREIYMSFKMYFYHFWHVLALFNA